MRPLLRKHILFLFSYSSAPARALQACAFWSSPQHWRRLPQEEESRNVKVSVWWDFKHCSVPADFDAYKVAPAITEALRANGIKGPLHITAFGNVNLLAKSHQEALASTGVNFIHVSDGGRNSANLLVDLMFWVYENPPPAHLFLISGDKDLAGALHRLRMNNYNILLCSTGKAPVALCSAATIMWQWSSLLKRDNLIGKHFNHPPDGMCDSWYGDSKVPLENLFSAAEKSASLQNKEIYEPSLDSKLNVVPNSVEQQVKHILSLHPKGISMTDLQAELIKCDVLYRRIYGFKRFSHFLLSIPHVQLQPLEDGNFCVCLVSSKSPEPFESSVVPSTTSVVKNEENEENEEMRCEATQKLNGEDKNKAIDAHETPSTSPFHERSLDDDSKLFQPAPPQGKIIGEDGKSSFSSLPERPEFKTQKELQNSSPASEKVVDGANEQLLEILLPFQDNKVSKTEMEPLKLRSKKSSHNDIVKPEDASCEIIEKHTASANHFVGNDCTTMENNGNANYDSGNFTTKNKCENPTRKEVDEVCHSQDSFPVNDSLVDERSAGSTESNGEGPKFFSWVRSWWPFWKSNAKSDDLAAHENKKGSHLEDSKLSQPDQTVSHFEEPKSSELDQNVSSSGKPELSSVSFWSDMESFIFTPKGSRLFSQSKNREDMANKLQNDGPQFLRSRTKKDIIQLVELLVAEKKWLVESPSKTFPFRLAQPVHKNSLMGQSHGTNGLRSLFLSRKSESNLQKSSEHDVEKHNMNIPDTRVSTTVPETKYTERSRNDILEDCQKLVNEILREHPEGYNICSFRRHFVDKYGYHLDMQKLGHEKLSSLLQTMPGVKLQSTFLFPSVPADCASKRETSPLKEITNASNAVSNSNGELSDSAPKESNMESQWEELGPVSVKNSNQSGLESKLSQETIEQDTLKHPDYEPIDPGYDSSESEGDSLCITQPEKEGKPKCNEQDSSLWQALDLWHSSKKWENSNNKSENVDHLSNSLTDILNSSTESTQGTISKIPLENRRQRSQKNYSFVADPVLHDKDGLVDGKLNGFKKAEESKVQN